MRLGVFLPNWIGDVVMATPALDSLRELAGPDGCVVGVMRPYVSDVLDGSNALDRRLFYNPRSEDHTLSTRHVISALKGEQLDAIVLMTNSLGTAWIARRAGARERIGYVRDYRSWLLTTRLWEPVKHGKRAQLPAIDSYLNLAYAAGGEWRPPTLRLATTDADRAAADEAWSRLALPPGDRVVVFNTGGAYGDAKSWPEGHFAELAQRILDASDCGVLINCGPAEREAAARIAAAVDDPRVRSLGEIESLPIGMSKEIVRRCRLLVTTDSGPRFFGVAFGKPVVTLFGPTDPAVTRTHYARETVLTNPIDCQFCWKRTCPLGHHRCLRDLSVTRVFKAVEPELVRTATSPSPAAA